MPVYRQAIHFRTSHPHNDLHDEYVGNEDGDDTETFLTARFIQLLDFSHEDTNIHNR